MIVGTAVSAWGARFFPDRDRARRQVWVDGQVDPLERYGEVLAEATPDQDLDLVALLNDAVSSLALKSENDDDITALRDRLQRIEDRLPDQAIMDKVSSANEAILATRIEALEKQLDRLTSETLTKWDVVVVVGQCVAGIAAVVAAMVALSRFTTGG